MRPVKEINPNSTYYGKYYFLAFDPDVTLYLDKIETLSHELNNDYEYKKINRYNLSNQYDLLINDINDINEDWSPTKKRYDYLLIESGIDPIEYSNNHLKRISKRRSVQKIKDGKD